jgi:two-component system response regulator
MNRTGIILLVEDNPDDVDLTLRAFQNNRIRNKIVVARDGQEALDYLFAACANSGRTPVAIPEVVLLDLKLPKVDGIEVLRRLRADERTKRLPVVMLTSSNEDRDIVASYDFGANSFLRKPVTFPDLVKVVEALGLYWLLLNEPPPVPDPSNCSGVEVG